MIIKVLIIFSFFSFATYAEDGLGMGGGPPATIINPIAAPASPTDSLNVGRIHGLILPKQGQAVTDGLLCKESATTWKPYRHNRDELARWPIDEGAGCLGPLKEFSRKLSYARAPLALSFATFIDGLEKHLSHGSIRWKSCTKGCAAKDKAPLDCIEATPLISRIVQFPAGTENYVLNKKIWDEVSQTQPLVCAASVVDLWLSSHVSDQKLRTQMVNGFFSAKFHANSDGIVRCFDPTEATRPFESFDGQIQNILLQMPNSKN